MIPAPGRELVLRWMEGSGGSDVVDIVQQVAVKAAAWGWMQQQTEPFRKPNEQWEWHHVSYRANSPF
jgi:hypothetical protein